VYATVLPDLDDEAKPTKRISDVVIFGKSRFSLENMTASSRRRSPVPAPSALVRAEHAAAPVHLVPADRRLLEEALRRGEDLREQVESAVTTFGRWILDAVFGGSTSAALDERTKNPVWTELVRRAGGPTLRVSRRILYVAVAIAANDKRITDQAWRGLDAARKELLLPLRSGDAIREAAQQVARFNLTQAKTRELVTATLGSQGRSRQVRMTGRGLVSRVRGLRDSLDDAGVLRRVSELGRSLEVSERKRALEEIDRLKEVLGKVSRALRGAGKGGSS
jgi:hypothetical protein